MELYQKIQHFYPDIQNSDFWPRGRIHLGDDGQGAIIKYWNYPAPQPTKEQLDALE